jgi:hypothetical protein
MKAYKAGKKYFKEAHIPIISVFLILILFSKCNITEPPINGKEITLKVEDVSCTEAWITLTTTNLQLPTTVILKQNNQPRSTINLIKADSLLYIDSLLPNTNYQYQVTSDQQQASSNELTVTTMDTTSNDFAFTTYTFGGQAGSCTLYDVAIIDENDIWAVGEIYLLDSLGQPDPHAYNAVHWDGNKWEIKRLKYYGSCSAVEYPPLKAIWAFSNNDMVITNGGSIGWFNGNTVTLDCGVNPLLTGAINKIWGTDSHDLYVVGNNGSIAHYQNGQWSKIESGTTTNIKDIWGKVNPVTQNKIIYCAVSNVVTSGEYKILSIKENNTVDSISWNTGRRVESIWFEDNLKMFTAGGGVFINNGDNNWIEQTELPLIHTNRIRGLSKNDVFVGGDFGLLAHFNGVNWRVYPETNVLLFYSLDYKNNLLTAVGRNQNGQAVISIMEK